jgi:superfamily 6 holin (LLH)
MNTSLVWSIATVLVPLLLPFLIALAASLYSSLMQRLPMQQRLIVSSMAHTVVTAVEQMLPADASGTQKKTLAVQWLSTVLSHAGVGVPAQFLNVAIEAAVFELHTLYPHSATDAGPSDLAGPFPYRPTLRSLPTVEPPASPSAPTVQLASLKETQQ